MRMRRWGLVAVLAAAFALLMVGSASAGAGQGQLENQKVRARPVFEIQGVVFTDADEQRGLLVVGVTNKGLATAVKARLKQLGIPLASVEIVVTEPIVFANTLQENGRPLEGGLQIGFQDGGQGWLCTLGFNAVRGDDKMNGFVVNSHCTTDQFKLDGTNHYQPWLSPSSNLAGTEIADPSAFKCARGKKCRYSDAAYDQLADGVEATLGSIARPDSVNSGSLTIDAIDGSFTVVGEAGGNAKVGTTLNKVGRTTGWTQGQVTKSKVDTGVFGTNIVLLDQDFVGAEVGGGDSGSPVFKITGGTDVQLSGILWGGASDGSFFVYSPITNVERELGELTTSGETATVNDAPAVTITSPDDGSIFDPGVEITFNGTASDTEDEDLTADLVWTDQTGRSLGTGASVSATFTDGVHTITASVTDTGGKTGSDSVSITVGTPPATPTLSVTVATDKGSYVNKEKVHITATVIDGTNPVEGATVDIIIDTPKFRLACNGMTTNGDGQAFCDHKVNSKRDGTGTYNITANASKAGYDAGSGSNTFEVTK